MAQGSKRPITELHDAMEIKLGGRVHYDSQVRKIIDYLIEKDPAKNINPALTTNGTWDPSAYYEKFVSSSNNCNPSADGVGPCSIIQDKCRLGSSVAQYIRHEEKHRTDLYFMHTTST